MSKFSVEEVSPTERRVRFEVPTEKVGEELDTAYRLLSQKVKVPGFRPGRVPRRILEARFKDQVEGEVIHQLVQQSFAEAAPNIQGLVARGPLRVTNDGLKPGEPFRYQAHVEVMPKLDPQGYQGLEIKRRKVEVTEERIDTEIEKLRAAMAELIAVEGRASAEEGDFAVVDYQGTIGGKPFAGGKGENANMEIVPGDFSEGKLIALRGVAIGGTCEIDHTFPKNHRLAELAGKTAHLKITLKALKQRKLPALDDELAKQMGAGLSLKDLKEKLRSQIVEHETDQVEREVREQIVGQLIKNNSFDVPPSLVESALDRMIESTLERFVRQGLDPRRMNLDLERMRESLREQALTEVKGALLLTAIADKEKIQASEADVDKKVKEIAQRLKTPEAKVKAQLAGDREKAFTHRLREERTLAFLESKAKIPQSGEGAP
jgi:trigger factor